jgi:hypothetical protein
MDGLDTLQEPVLQNSRCACGERVIPFPAGNRLENPDNEAALLILSLGGIMLIIFRCYSSLNETIILNLSSAYLALI